MLLPKYTDPFEGSNTKLLAVKVSQTLYDALAATAEREKISLPKLVRHSLHFFFLPSILEQNLRLIRTKYTGKKTLEAIGKNQRLIDEARVDLGKMTRTLEAFSALFEEANEAIIDRVGLEAFEEVAKAFGLKVVKEEKGPIGVSSKTTKRKAPGEVKKRRR